MIRYKILGADSFNQALLLPPNPINSDIGNFVIGPSTWQAISLEDLPIPPKQLWIKAAMEFIPCGVLAVIRADSQSFAWMNHANAEKVRLVPTQILRDSSEMHHWQLQPQIFEHKFAVATTIHFNNLDSTINLWPCGGKITHRLLEIEQQYAQVPSDPTDSQMYVNSLSALKKHALASFVFQPPEAQAISLSTAITTGIITIKITGSNHPDDLGHIYTSCIGENLDNDDTFIKILFERKDQ